MPCYNYEGDELQKEQSRDKTALDSPQQGDKASALNVSVATEQGSHESLKRRQPEESLVPSQKHQVPVDNLLDQSFPPPQEQDRVVLTSVSTPSDSRQKTFFGPSEEEVKAYAFAYRLTAFSSIIAAVSIAIGGVPLSLMALICAFVANSKIKKHVQDAHVVMANEWKQLNKLIRVTFGISCLALILNAISTYVLFTTLQDAGYGYLFGFGPIGNPAPSGSSVWG